MVDWSQFGIDLLAGAITLILGWILAEFVIYRFQRKRAERDLINTMIDELSEVRKLFQEIFNKWSEVKKRYYKIRVEMKEEDVQEINNRIQLHDEMQFKVFMKLRNSFPEWNTKKVNVAFLQEIGTTKELEFGLSDIILSVGNTNKIIYESISSGDFSEEMSAIIYSKFREPYSCYTAIILNLTF